MKRRIFAGIIPFIRPDDPRSHSTVFSIAEAPEALYASSPSKMLDLIAAVVGDASPGSVYALGKALERIRALEPTLADKRKFQKLISYAAPQFFAFGGYGSHLTWVRSSVDTSFSMGDRIYPVNGASSVLALSETQF